MWVVLLLIVGVVVVVVCVSNARKKKAVEILQGSIAADISKEIKAELEKKGYTVRENKPNFSMGCAYGTMIVSESGKYIGDIIYDGMASYRACLYPFLFPLWKKNTGISHLRGEWYFGINFSERDVFLKSSVPSKTEPEWLKIAGYMLASELRSYGVALTQPAWISEMGFPEAVEYMNTIFG
ncbi:MAG: hypothetical protein FWH20_02450 [Oscillospiraceae bacterium]|nr:hypothetical protein [Oscillospiraceae bacterium]